MNKKQSGDDFVRNHHHICYCEAIIYPDGDIEYANPSHVEALIRITGESRDVINDKMPITASPIHWLILHTKCVALWYDFAMVPSNITKEQEETMKKLEELK